ncbi:MAG: BREX system ATP-binding protein BrxD [Xenococcaceae cyanobacterium MO_188.B32]|nr:BREX system ATP-binding protein BrxD [Xenococcaceae cyanobacterium MO_188.B32]
MALSERDIEHIFEKLRSGVVPERGLEAFAVGIEQQWAEIHRQLKLASDREGVFKFFRGGYGCGKTFMSRLTLNDAQSQGFATSFVVVSDNDLHFHKFDDVYRRVVQELGTNSCPRGALADILDRWIAKVEDALIAAGADEDSSEFDEQVAKRLEEELASITGGKAPEDMARVLRSIFELKQQGNFSEASALISWLSGSENVAASAKRIAGIKGDIGSREALDYLQGILEIVKAASYKGLVIVIDEAETILRMRRDIREKSLNGIRQICDAADRYQGLLWIFTGTPEFFDTQRGIAGLAPLHDRIKFSTYEGFVNPRQPQLELKPFDRERLKEVALKLRDTYPIDPTVTVPHKISPEFIQQLIDKVTTGFKGDVGVVPRQFLREFINILDLAHQNKNFDPSQLKEFKPQDLNIHEESITQERNYFESEPDDIKGYAAVEF